MSRSWMFPMDCALTWLKLKTNFSLFEVQKAMHWNCFLANKNRVVTGCFPFIKVISSWESEETHTMFAYYVADIIRKGVCKIHLIQPHRLISKQLRLTTTRPAAVCPAALCVPALTHAHRHMPLTPNLGFFYRNHLLLAFLLNGKPNICLKHKRNFLTLGI